jgi:hypothetical protein
MFLMCIQPGCDSVRLPAETDIFFPFIRFNEGTEQNHNISVLDFDGVRQYLNFPDKKPTYALFSFSFRAKSSDNPYVEAVVTDAGFGFKVSGKEVTYRWVGNIRAEQAQRLASKLAARLHTPGVDEFEWLRLKSK